MSGEEITAAYGNGFRGLHKRAEDLKKQNAAEDAKAEKIIKNIVRIQQKWVFLS